MHDELRQCCRDLIGTLSHLDGLIVEHRLPRDQLHRLLFDVDQMRAKLFSLVDGVEATLPAEVTRNRKRR